MLLTRQVSQQRLMAILHLKNGMVKRSKTPIDPLVLDGLMQKEMFGCLLDQVVTRMEDRTGMFRLQVVDIEMFIQAERLDSNPMTIDGETIMKNIQVIDGANNCAYDVYSATEEEFLLIFPEPEQDIQFIEDIQESENVKKALSQIWKRRLEKPKINGIHGTLFYELIHKKQFYPNKKDSDLTANLGRAQS
jgi:hypothetical protein